VKIKPRMQVQCQVQPKNNGKLIDNNGNTKSRGGLIKEREKTNRQHCIDCQEYKQKPSKRPDFLRRASGPYPIETKQEGFHMWKRNRIRAN